MRGVIGWSQAGGMLHAKLTAFGVHPLRPSSPPLCGRNKLLGHLGGANIAFAHIRLQIIRRDSCRVRGSFSLPGQFTRRGIDEFRVALDRAPKLGRYGCQDFPRHASAPNNQRLAVINALFGTKLSSGNI